jgi:hypothetical protein
MNFVPYDEATRWKGMDLPEAGQGTLLRFRTSAQFVSNISLSESDAGRSQHSPVTQACRAYAILVPILLVLAGRWIAV